jgi:hypothetical protein
MTLEISCASPWRGSATQRPGPSVSVPVSQGRIAGYRIGEDQSAGITGILQPVSRARSAVGQTRSFGDVGSMSGLPETGHGWRIASFCAAASRALRPYLSSHDSAGGTAGAGLGACDNSLETIHFAPEYCGRAVFLRRGKWGDENGRTGNDASNRGERSETADGRRNPGYGKGSGRRHEDSPQGRDGHNRDRSYFALERVLVRRVARQAKAPVRTRRYNSGNGIMGEEIGAQPSPTYGSVAGTSSSLRPVGRLCCQRRRSHPTKAQHRPRARPSPYRPQSPQVPRSSSPRR